MNVMNFNPPKGSLRKIWRLRRFFRFCAPHRARTGCSSATMMLGAAAPPSGGAWACKAAGASSRASHIAPFVASSKTFDFRPASRCERSGQPGSSRDRRTPAALGPARPAPATGLTWGGSYCTSSGDVRSAAGGISSSPPIRRGPAPPRSKRKDGEIADLAIEEITADELGYRGADGGAAAPRGLDAEASVMDGAATPSGFDASCSGCSPGCSPFPECSVDRGVWNWRGHDITYVHRGTSGPCVLLLHGFGCGSFHYGEHKY